MVVAARVAVGLLALVLASNAVAQCPPVVGDVNGDDATTIVDVQCLILTSLWALAANGEGPPTCLSESPDQADINCDGTPNVVDVQLGIAVTLGTPLDPAVDANGNQCPDSCEGPSDCCDVDAEVCSSASCEAAVCAVLPACCTEEWTADCTVVALDECLECATGECDDGICDASEDCSTCPQDCFACPVCGDDICDFGESCADCPGDCGACEICGDGVCAPGESCVSCVGDCGSCKEDCCSAHGEVGCETASCQDCVCSVDAFCCDTSWDSTCAASANPGGDCAAACPDCDGGGCPDCEAPCCEAHAGTGCESSTCEGCVCGLDSFCCDSAWDGLCAQTAIDFCPGDCECGGASASGLCCDSSFETGCEDPACETCVCDEDPFCCLLFWDSSCVGIASDACEPECGCEPTDLSCFEAINCMVFCGGDEACEDQCLLDSGPNALVTIVLWSCLENNACVGSTDPGVFPACLSGPCASEADACFE